MHPAPPPPGGLKQRGRGWLPLRPAIAVSDPIVVVVVVRGLWLRSRAFLVASISPSHPLFLIPHPLVPVRGCQVQRGVKVDNRNNDPAFGSVRCLCFAKASQAKCALLGCCVCQRAPPPVPSPPRKSIRCRVEHRSPPSRPCTPCLCMCPRWLSRWLSCSVTLHRRRTLVIIPHCPIPWRAKQRSKRKRQTGARPGKHSSSVAGIAPPCVSS